MEELLWNGVTYRHPYDQFPLGTDSVACAAFARFPKGVHIADLGCGSGAIGLMLLASDPTCRVTGIELQPDAAQAAKDNGAENNLNLQVICGDLRKIRELLPPASVDGCISNPPYFPVGSGQTAAGSRGDARSEATCSLSQLTDAAAWLLPTGGKFCLVHRPERLADLIWELRSRQLEPKRIQFVRHSSKKPVSLVLMEARKGGRPGLVYEPDLILWNEDGTPTAQADQIYHRTNL